MRGGRGAAFGTAHGAFVPQKGKTWKSNTRRQKKHPRPCIGPYSQSGVCRESAVHFGQIPIDPATGEIAGATIEEQARQSVANVGAILEANGTSFDKVVKTTCFLADMSDFAAFNAVYAEAFVSRPARSCVAVKTLPKNVLCEIEAIAAL
ncbi:MAG: Rid family detoxifying hydrolase [Ruthenibacterium lactatiformans]